MRAGSFAEKKISDPVAKVALDAVQNDFTSTIFDALQVVLDMERFRVFSGCIYFALMRTIHDSQR